MWVKVKQSGCVTAGQAVHCGLDENLYLVILGNCDNIVAELYLEVFKDTEVHLRFVSGYELR